MVNEDLVLAHLKAARRCGVAFARRHQRMGLDPEECVSAAYQALVDSAPRFDPSRGFSFWSFVRPRVAFALLDILRAYDQLTGSRYVHTEIIELPANLAERPTEMPDLTRDTRVLSKAIAALDPVSQARIRRYAIADASQGNPYSEAIHEEFGLSRADWQNERRAILARLRFELRIRSVTKVSDCL